MTKNRWRIALLIAAAIAVSYFDRQTLSVAIKAIQAEIPITNTQFSQLQTAFLLAYAAMYAIGGRLVDALGTRRGFLLIMVWWSLACASHGLATGFGMLAVSRFLLGMGEGGGFPAATKAVAEWFSPRESATAMGIINAGTAVGAVCAPPLIAVTLSSFNWHWVFFFSGAIGLLWCVWWAFDYSSPIAVVKKQASVSWFRLLAFRETWGLVCAKFLSDSAWYFYLFWLPKYLYDARGFDTKQVGAYAWIPYAASGIGCLCGGWLSSRLIRAGKSVNFSRKLALGLSAGVMPLAFFVTKTPVEMAIVLFSIAFFGQQSWSTLVMILPADLFPRSAVGSVAGLVGFGGAIGGAVFGLVVGYLLDHGYGYSAVFAIVSTLHVIGFLVILVTVRRVEPLMVEGVQ
ncbi:MAG TPA: MFS transporter [Bryobacteraceae bacterium]|jgi:ACS family hexuronate transporter-like MFS transporter|nr:MFS transporter [Bryobacteraceae bacterium]